ncbi:MAG: hypothetical protein ACRD18_11590, partial [Terriglobia bacterium]
HRFINDLPLTSRSVYDLAQLAPGVSQPGGRAFGLSGGETNFVYNGGRNSTADILVDGVSQTSFEQNSGVTNALYTPEVDAVQEFKVQQNTYNAAVGYGSTVLNVISKSGTNQFHGSLFEFLQNSSLNSNNFFNNANGVPITPSRQNQFGGTFGGPIRKNKTFFFLDYQGTRSSRSSTQNAGVPSMAERKGDFSEVCTRVGGTFNAQGLCSNPNGQIWDPYSGVFNNKLNGPLRSAFVPGNNLAAYISPGNPKLAGTPYEPAPVAGNLIDPVAFKMMQDFPLPNVAVGTPAYDYQNNWIGSGSRPDSDNVFDVKIDHRLSDATMLTGRVSRDSYSGLSGAVCFHNSADPCTSGPSYGNEWSGSLSFNHTFTPTLILTATYGYARAANNDGGVAQLFPSFNPVTTLGLPPYILTSGYLATPDIRLGNGYQQAGEGALGSRPFSILHQRFDTHTLDVSLEKMAGQHELKFGYEGRMHITSFIQVGEAEGQFSYSLTGTSQTPRNGTGGDALASFLIGFTQGGNPYEVDPAVTTQNFAHAFYFQDNWHATSRLTVDIGLRYELTLPRTERYNRQSWVDPTVTSPLQVPNAPKQSNFQPLKGGLVFASNSDRTPYLTDYNNWGPRVGIAYRTFKNTVIRTGYGIFYDPIKGAAAGTGGGGFQGYKQQTSQTRTYQNDGATPFAPLSNPFPLGIELPPGNSQGLLTSIGQGISGSIQNWNMTPYMQTWNFGLEHVFLGNVLVDLNYVGTKGTHLYYGSAGSLNFLGPFVETATPAEITALNAHVPNPFYGVITDPNASLSSSTVRASQLLLPYPEFTGFSGNDPPWANSVYNALQLTVEKRFSHGLQLLGTYVWSKSLDD